MKKNILIFFAVFLLAILEISFLPKFFGRNLSPSLVLIFIILVSKDQGWRESWKWAVLAGMILDVASFGIIGVHSFSFLIISLLIGFVSERFLTSQKFWKIFVVVILIFLSSFLNDAMVAIFMKLEFLFSKISYLEWDVFSLGKSFFRALSSAILGVVLYKPIKKFQKTLFDRR